MDHTSKLIITSCDISDADGWLALARYAQTGADCMFVMNFPAYVEMCENVAAPMSDALAPGLGYRYTAQRVLERPSDAWGCADVFRYTEYKERVCGGRDGEDGAGMSELAAMMASQVWFEAGAERQLFYCVGGVNDTANELQVYSPLLPGPQALPRCRVEEDAVFLCHTGGAPTRASCVCEFEFGFMAANGYVYGRCLHTIVGLYYGCKAKAKPFDCYVADTVCSHVATGQAPQRCGRRALLFNSRYGVTLLSREDGVMDVQRARGGYMATLAAKAGVPSEEMRKMEIAKLGDMEFDFSCFVGMLKFDFDYNTKALTLARI